MASESPHNAAPSTWARMLSGCTWVPTSVATVNFLTLISPDGKTATWATHAVQLAVARSCEETQATPMPSPCGSFLVPQHDEFGIDPGGAGRDRAGARRELVAGIDVPDIALELRRGVHRLHRRMGVDVGGVFRLHQLGRRAERRRGVAVLDEEQPGI